MHLLEVADEAQTLLGEDERMKRLPAFLAGLRRKIYANAVVFRRNRIGKVENLLAAAMTGVRGGEGAHGQLLSKNRFYYTESIISCPV